MLGVKIKLSSQPNKSELHSKFVSDKYANGQDMISFLLLASTLSSEMSEGRAC